MVKVYFHCYPAQPSLCGVEIELSSTIDKALAVLKGFPDLRNKHLFALKWNPKTTSYDQALKNNEIWSSDATIQEYVDYTGINLKDPHDLIWIIYGYF